MTVGPIAPSGCYLSFSPLSARVGRSNFGAEFDLEADPNTAMWSAMLSVLGIHMCDTSVSRCWSMESKSSTNRHSFHAQYHGYGQIVQIV